MPIEGTRSISNEAVDDVNSDRPMILAALQRTIQSGTRLGAYYVLTRWPPDCSLQSGQLADLSDECDAEASKRDRHCGFD